MSDNIGPNVTTRKSAIVTLWRDRGMNAPFTRINRDVDIMGGKACIKGTRVTVGMILMQISEGISIEKLLQEYPFLTAEDISEALRYAAWVVGAKEELIVSA